MARRIKTLLKLVAKQKKLFDDNCGGLCVLIGAMHDEGVINSDEYRLLQIYLEDHSRGWGYWWPEGQWEPRLEWLNKQISKL